MVGYLAVYRLWAKWCEAQAIDVHTSSAQDITRWLDSRRPISASTVHNALCSLRAYYRYLIACNLRPDDPTLAFKIRRPQLPAVWPYSDADLDRLFAACRKPRDRAMLLLLLRTGVRASELAAIRERDIRWKEGTIEILGKGGKHRLVAPGSEAMGAVRTYLDSKAGNIWGFDGYRGVAMWLVTLATRAGVKANAHRWRHTFACQWLEAGGAEGSLQLLLGHSDLAMTLHYAAAVRGKVALEQQKRYNERDRDGRGRPVA